MTITKSLTAYTVCIYVFYKTLHYIYYVYTYKLIYVLCIYVYYKTHHYIYYVYTYKHIIIYLLCIYVYITKMHELWVHLVVVEVVEVVKKVDAVAKRLCYWSCYYFRYMYILLKILLAICFWLLHIFAVSAVVDVNALRVLLVLW